MKLFCAQPLRPFRARFHCAVARPSSTSYTLEKSFGGAAFPVAAVASEYQVDAVAVAGSVAPVACAASSARLRSFSMSAAAKPPA